MTHKLDNLERQINAIKDRNKRVEADKAWEVSWTRKVLVAVLTYIVILVFMFMVGFEKPYASAIVPAAAYLISMSTLYIFKKLWISKIFTRIK